MSVFPAFSQRSRASRLRTFSTSHIWTPGLHTVHSLPQPAAAVCCSLPQPASACCCSVLQPASACLSLPQPAAACCSLLQPATACRACCNSLLQSPSPTRRVLPPEQIMRRGLGKELLGTKGVAAQIWAGGNCRARPLGRQCLALRRGSVTGQRWPTGGSLGRQWCWAV
jgi:hypothetical protein